jgi:hypothetical protein
MRWLPPRPSSATLQRSASAQQMLKPGMPRGESWGNWGKIGVECRYIQDIEHAGTFFCICSSQNGLISSTIIGDDVDAGWVLIFVASIWFQFPCLDKALTKPYTPWQSHGQKLGYITYISIWMHMEVS